MNKWKTKWVNVEDINEAKVNANKMSDKDFEKLVKNIKKSGGLSSAITCYLQEDGRYVIISGHHRYKACVSLSYVQVPVIYANESDLDRDEIIALQLSHNSLHGEDNKGILKRLLDEIQSIDFKDFAHINVEEIGSIDTFNSSITPMSEHYNVSFILYKKDLSLLEELLGDIQSDFQKSELVILANQDNSEEMLLELTKAVGKKYNIKSGNISFWKILELAKKQLENEDLDSNN